MRFASLRVAGFKSFVDPVELRFAPGLTGVVGPNGCGKSNLLEAIRWTMGESSPKSLRGGGMEDVIFAGTAARPARQFAEVRLGLDNSDRTAPGPWHAEPSLEVVRRIERGLGSAYRINGRDVRQRDVQLLFADAGSGAHSPALVSQGRIGAIVNAKPSERRALLEEAAGIAGLNVRRNEAELRLRAAAANLAKLDETLGQQTAQAASLRRAARQAERYTDLSTRIETGEAQLLHARWRDDVAAAEAAAATASERAAAAARATGSAASASTTCAAAAAALPALRDAEREAVAALLAAEGAREALVRERAEVDRRLRELADAETACARDAAREAVFGGDAAAALARLDAEAADLAARHVAADTALPKLQSSVAAAERGAATAEAALGSAIESRARAQALSRAADAAIAAAEARATRDAGARAGLVDELARLAAGDDTRPAARAALAAAAASLDTARATEAEAETGRAAATSALESATAALAGSAAALTALTAEHAALLRLSARPAAPGGPRAGDSIRVAPGYEAALAAALGDDLDAPLGVEGWAGAPGEGDPPLPAGAQPLAALVDAPPQLARRLAQIGVTDIGETLAPSLAPGQRLVSTDGALWRWDGFRAAPGRARPTAERLAQRNRLDALAPALADAEAARAEAAAQAVRAAAAQTEAAAADTAARAARAAAERAHAVAAAELARAEALAERSAARHTDARAALDRLDAAARATEAERQAAAADRAAAGDLAALAAAMGTARGVTEAARVALASARAAFDTLRRDAAAGSARSRAVADERAAWARRAETSLVQRAALQARATELAAALTALAGRPAELAAALAGHAEALAAARGARAAAGDALAAAETALAAADAASRAADAALAERREALVRADVDAAHTRARAEEAASAIVGRFALPPADLPTAFGFAPHVAADPTALDVLRAERERLGPVNLRAAIELAELEAGHTALAAERAELDTAIARLRGSIGALNREGRTRLLAAFRAVDGHFRTLFTTLFTGGQARLELVESDDPLESGLELMAQPPGKALASLSLLSGGEQALTACALIFALFLASPAPFCVLDEVDAPLDDANVERFCDLLDRVAAETGTRFLVVTHNAVTMSRMHRLFGVTMAEPGVSQLVSVDLARAEALLFAAE